MIIISIKGTVFIKTIISLLAQRLALANMLHSSPWLKHLYQKSVKFRKGLCKSIQRSMKPQFLEPFKTCKTTTTYERIKAYKSPTTGSSLRIPL